MRRVGIFGGSFDPVHRAHVALARTALADLALDELRWIPAGNPWQKTGELTAAEHRVAMIASVIEGEPRFVLDRRELLRAGPSYTLDTVRELQREAPETDWYLVIGEDQYAGLHTWNGWRELLERITLAVARRPGVTRAPDPQVQAAPQRLVSLPMTDLSSTDVRRRLEAGEPVGELVPDAVARYIDQHCLYRGPAGS